MLLIEWNVNKVMFFAYLITGMFFVNMAYYAKHNNVLHNLFSVGLLDMNDGSNQ